jgi:hypothetical protein
MIIALILDLLSNFSIQKKILKVGFLERDFDHDHLAEKSN